MQPSPRDNGGDEAREPEKPTIIASSKNGTPSERPQEVAGVMTGPAHNYFKGGKYSLGSKHPKGSKKRSQTKAEPLSVNISMVGVREQATP